MSSFLSEDDWRDLLREIHNRQVIPVVGPELVTVPDPNGNGQLPLYRALAPQLASRLRLPVTIDSLLTAALEKSRSGFRRQEHVLSYDYKRPVDVPERTEPALVYHIVGSRQTYPNFAVWEEDYLEFICGLIRHHAQLERLFLLLKTHYLLLLGAPFDDWIVRFFSGS